MGDMAQVFAIPDTQRVHNTVVQTYTRLAILPHLPALRAERLSSWAKFSITEVKLPIKLQLQNTYRETSITNNQNASITFIKKIKQWQFKMTPHSEFVVHVTFKISINDRGIIMSIVNG